MIQFYAPDILANPVLPESDSGHAVRVLRMQQGDELTVVDGRGHRCKCRLEVPHPKHVVLDVVSVEDVPQGWTSQITVAVAPTKNMDRMEWLLEKLVEVGINRFVPVLCQRSERKEVKPARLEKIAVSAMKQSLKATLPELQPMTSLPELLRATWLPQNRYFGYCADDIERHNFAKEYIPGSDVIMLIGPEGDFSPSEANEAVAAGFRPVTLGNERLRTETAALYSAITIHSITQRFQ